MRDFASATGVGASRPTMTGRFVAIVGLAALISGTAMAEPTDEIDCLALEKQANGTWSAKTPTTVTLGGGSVRLFRVVIRPHSIKLRDRDVYEALESKCGR